MVFRYIPYITNRWWSLWVESIVTKNGGWIPLEIGSAGELGSPLVQVSACEAAGAFCLLCMVASSEPYSKLSRCSRNILY